MKKTDLPYRATLDEYQQHAEALLAALQAGDESAAWRFKWVHPRFRGKTVDAVSEATLDFSDAQLVIAQENSFEIWDELRAFTEAVAAEGPVARFEEAVEVVVNGDAAALRSMLRDTPQLVRERSTRRHHCTLLHYLGANGVEGGRQKTPSNAVEIAKVLLDGGAEADALADLYENKCTTMSMLVSSTHPAQAGLQIALAETLLDYGAAFEGAGSKWDSALMTALTFGYIDTAEALVRRGAPVNNLAAAAGLGRAEDVARLLPSADAESRHAAVALASQHGHTEVMQLLLDAGEDPNRYNPDGFHSHATPLHNAIWSEQMDLVRLLVERGARLDIKDTIYCATPLGWATYGGKTAIAEYLRSVGGS